MMVLTPTHQQVVGQDAGALGEAGPLWVAPLLPAAAAEATRARRGSCPTAAGLTAAAAHLQAVVAPVVVTPVARVGGAGQSR